MIRRRKKEGKCESNNGGETKRELYLLVENKGKRKQVGKSESNEWVGGRLGKKEGKRDIKRKKGRERLLYEHQLF